MTSKRHADGRAPHPRELLPHYPRPDIDALVATRSETERLVVRTFETRDGDAWVDMFNDPEVTRFMPESPP